MTNDLIFVSLLCSFIIGTLAGACGLWLCLRCRCEPGGGGGGTSSRSAVAPLRMRPPITTGGGAPVAPDRS